MVSKKGAFTAISVPDSSVEAAFKEGTVEKGLSPEDQPSQTDIEAARASISRIVEEVNVFLG